MKLRCGKLAGSAVEKGAAADLTRDRSFVGDRVDRPSDRVARDAIFRRQLALGGKATGRRPFERSLNVARNNLRHVVIL